MPVSSILTKTENSKESLEKFKYFVYSKDFSFIIDNPESEECWEFPAQDRKLLNLKEHENFMNVLTKDAQSAMEKRQDFKKLQNLQSLCSDFYIFLL